MPAYWISRCIINDPVSYKKYTDQVPGIIAQYGAKVLARGGKYQIMEGPEDFKRFVVLEFPTSESAVNCFQSEEYKAAASSIQSNNLPPNNVPFAFKSSGFTHFLV